MSACMPFSPDQFRRRYPDRAMPDLRFFSSRRRWEMQQRLAQRFDPRLDDPDESAVWALFDGAAAVEEQVTSDPASLDWLLLRCGAAPADRIYLDWYAGDCVEAALTEFTSAFFVFWEAGVDDLALFDEQLGWIVYFTHAGGVRFLQAPDPPADPAPDEPPGDDRIEGFEHWGASAPDDGPKRGEQDA